jgi:trimethylamine--corrinoid protein Co-methyltransferase
MRNYQTAFYEPALSDSENVESWEERGSTDMRARAHAQWTGMLEAYEKPMIDEGIDEALKDYIARRKSEIPEAWY